MHRIATSDLKFAPFHSDFITVSPLSCLWRRCRSTVKTTLYGLTAPDTLSAETPGIRSAS